MNLAGLRSLSLIRFVISSLTIRTSQGHAAILVEVFTVLLSEYEEFVEPFQVWELN